MIFYVQYHNILFEYNIFSETNKLLRKKSIKIDKFILINDKYLKFCNVFIMSRRIISLIKFYLNIQLFKQLINDTIISICLSVF